MECGLVLWIVCFVLEWDGLDWSVDKNVIAVIGIDIASL